MSAAIAAPDWIEEQRRHLAFVTAESTEDTHSRMQTVIDLITMGNDIFRECLLRTDDQEIAIPIWNLVCDGIRSFAKFRESAGRVLLEQHCELARTVLLDRPDLNLTLPPDLEEIVWTIRIPPLAYLRAMWNLFWSAIRHPLSETTIDLSTGRVLYRT